MESEDETPVEVEHEYSVKFQLSSPNQIPIVRSIAPELLQYSTAELLHSARANNLSITVRSLFMWRAREYAKKAADAGIQSQII